MLARAFEADRFGDGGPSCFMMITASDDIFDRAARLTGSHGLRAYDAVQLSSALALASADPRNGTFVAFDRALRTAAATEGLSTPGPGGHSEPSPAGR